MAAGIFRFPPTRHPPAGFTQYRNQGVNETMMGWEGLLDHIFFDSHRDLLKTRGSKLVVIRSKETPVGIKKSL